MEWIADPSIWAGLVTLIVIELVLGIDNLVFIAILAEKTTAGAARPRAHYRPDTGDDHAPTAAGVNLVAGHLD
ncbi:Putative capsular polysaccharide transport protein YegH [Salmonella enterica subsp. enterica]|nr:Putative capsular polysaccharide transport protein YegH [Salmonella enterica subsp. enterica]